jgi:SAM-dependent methyltransferase
VAQGACKDTHVVGAHPERIVPDETEPGVVALHRKRYEFAEPACAGKDVLDLACGVGYGSAYLGRVARRVVGVDISDEAIAYARRRYASANVEFEVMDATALRLDDTSFDVVCAFEAIEHLPDPQAAVGEAARVLRSEGVLYASTPRAERTTASPANPFHHVEYAPDDFRALLLRGFESVELYGQRRLQTRRHRALQRLDVLGLRRRLTFLRPASRLLGTAPTAEVTSEGIVIEAGTLDRATELVAVCTRPRA